MSDESDETPIDRALSLLVYAPMGFALEARTLLPRFVERGRNQVALARVVGRFAVRKGREDIEGLLGEQQASAVGLLRLVGVVADEADEPDRAAGDDRPLLRAVEPLTPPEATDTSAAEAPEVTPPADAVDSETLAIPGYDSLAASQVVPRLASLSPDELETVRAYELANRGRKTILGKVAQLQAS